MVLFSDDISLLVFKRSIRDDSDAVSLNGRMLKVLLALDGKKNIAALNQSFQMSIDTLKKIISKLHDLQLVEEVEKTTPVLNAEFFDFLKKQLSLAMGPIAGFIVEDEMLEFSGNSKQIPLHRAAELVDLLARQIRRDAKRVEFQQAMIKKIKELNP